MELIGAVSSTAFDAILAGVDFTVFIEMFMQVAAVGVPAIIGVMVAKTGISYLLSWVGRAK